MSDQTISVSGHVPVLNADRLVTHHPGSNWCVTRRSAFQAMYQYESAHVLEEAQVPRGDHPVAGPRDGEGERLVALRRPVRAEAAEPGPPEVRGDDEETKR